VSFTPSKRQDAILEMVAQNGFVATDSIVSVFGVTPQTIRRDLNELHQHGLLTRFHGGAGQAQTSSNRPYKDRVNSRVEEKRRIARLAASLIPDGASIFLNTGTTIEAVARELLSRENLSVVTNNIKVAQILSANETFNVMVTGGRVRPHDGGITGSATIDFIGQFHMDFGIIGTNSIDEAGVFWDFDQEEVRLTQATINCSHRVILVADQHKFGRRAMNRVGELKEIDILITDQKPISPFSDLLEREDIVVHHVQDA